MKVLYQTPRWRISCRLKSWVFGAEFGIRCGCYVNLYYFGPLAVEHWYRAQRKFWETFK